MYTEQEVEDYLDGKRIYVPEELVLNPEWKKFRIEGRELTCLMWATIESTPLRPGSKGWRRVRHNRFSYGCGNGTIGKSKAWLKANAFIEESPSYIASQYSKSYKVKKKRNLVLVELAHKSLKDGLIKSTAEDDRCQYARKCMDALRFDRPGIVTELAANLSVLVKSATTDGKSINQIGWPLFAIINFSGRVFRGQFGNRLFSPMTHLKSDFRKFFSFDDAKMCILDMRCAQPSLLGNLANDHKLIEDSFSDEFYNGIMITLGVDRDEAKVQYCKYAYGHYDPKAPLTGFMQSSYQAADAFMESNKVGNYKKFSWLMQQAEAALFVDDVYAEIEKEGLPALTIHDGIFCRLSDSERIEELIQQSLDRKKYKSKIVKQKL